MYWVLIIYFILIGLDNQRVIIFGGYSSNAGGVATEDSLYVLNTSSLEWSIPKVSGKIPSNRHHHAANVVGKYMIITFGNNIIHFKPE